MEKKFLLQSLQQWLPMWGTSYFHQFKNYKYFQRKCHKKSSHNSLVQRFPIFFLKWRTIRKLKTSSRPERLLEMLFNDYIKYHFWIKIKLYIFRNKSVFGGPFLRSLRTKVDPSDRTLGNTATRVQFFFFGVREQKKARNRWSKAQGKRQCQRLNCSTYSRINRLQLWHVPVYQKNKTSR